MIESIVGVVIEVLLSERYMLYGAILLVLALSAEVLNGLIDIAVYTFFIGSMILFGLGIYSVMF